MIQLIDVDAAAKTRFTGGLPRKINGFVCLETDQAVAVRRWRPAIILGEEIEAFITDFFRTPALVPWSGFVAARDAAITSDGLTLVGNSMLLGNGLMYPIVCFPYPETGIKGSRESQNTWKIDIPEVSRTLPGLTCNVASPGLAIYGHWLIDALPRLQKVLSTGITISQFVVPGPKKSWQLDLLEALGISGNRVIFADFQSETLRCEEVIIPTFDRFNSEMRPDLIKVHQTIARKFASRELSEPADRKLFISRAAWGGARLLKDRNIVEEAFVRAGFEMVRPEQLSFADQVRLFARAAVVVGECGSGLHSAIYCRKGTRVGVIQSSSNANFLQAQIAMLAQQHVFFLIGKPEPAEPPVVAFSVDSRSLSLFISSLLTREESFAC